MRGTADNSYPYEVTSILGSLSPSRSERPIDFMYSSCDHSVTINYSLFVFPPVYFSSLRLPTFLPHRAWVAGILGSCLSNIPMFHNTSPVELQNVHHSSRWCTCHIFTEVHISRVVVETRMKDRKVCRCDEACKAVEARVSPARRSVRVVLDVGVIEVVSEGCFDIFVDVEFADKLVEDVGLFFRLGWLGWTENFR